MQVDRGFLGASLVLQLLLASSLTSRAQDRNPIQVQIDVGPRDRNHYELQVGDVAWTVRQSGDGVLASSVPVQVILWRVPGCDAVVRFTARPASLHRISVFDGRVRLNPGLAEPFGFGTAPHRPICRLPATERTEARPYATSGGRAFLFVSVFAVGFTAALRRRRIESARTRR